MKDSTDGKPEKPRYFRPYTRESLNKERPYSRRCLKGWRTSEEGRSKLTEEVNAKRIEDAKAAAGIPLKVMQTILGHSSLSMTADLYSHVLPDTRAEEMKKLQGII